MSRTEDMATPFTSAKTHVTDKLDLAMALALVLWPTWRDWGVAYAYDCLTLCRSGLQCGNLTSKTCMVGSSNDNNKFQFFRQ